MADTVQLLVRYEGKDAASNTINLRYFGQSMTGIDRIISLGLATLEHGDIPKSRFKSPMVARVAVPREGSFELQVLLEAVGLSPFLNQILSTYLPEFLRNWTSGVILNAGGRRAESVENFVRIMELKEQSDKRKDEIIRLLAQNNHEAYMKLSQRTINPAQDTLAPVDRSCDIMSVRNGDQTSEFDAATAFAVRSNKQLEVGPMETVCVIVDGLFRNTKQLKVIHPDEPHRVVTAFVRDPSFETEPNVYLDAMLSRGKITISCKAARKDGRIQRLYIMDATLPDRI